MDSGRALVIGIGGLALVAGAMSALSMDSGYLALVAPPQRVSEETRREIINRRGLKRCVYDIGGRAMFDASGAFIGCDRQPERRLVRKAERGDVP